VPPEIRYNTRTSELVYIESRPAYRKSGKSGINHAKIFIQSRVNSFSSKQAILNSSDNLHIKRPQTKIAVGKSVSGIIVRLKFE